MYIFLPFKKQSLWLQCYWVNTNLQIQSWKLLAVTGIASIHQWPEVELSYLPQCELLIYRNFIALQMSIPEQKKKTGLNFIKGHVPIECDYYFKYLWIRDIFKHVSSKAEWVPMYSSLIYWFPTSMYLLNWNKGQT